ncbi:hypothetical protein EQ836_08350 [Ectopseudomonas mendocina]|uniref:Uncharacterized protein n=1 Tax=Ectopseudomonas mendocina TaxID=300 RepID=A0ABD7RXJ8_ECTME|nr:hypothetical protein EQ829_10745 [Pseudomonas mendocina]TRO19520.1 hypothetical protein EQ836_08350 [Pseudomonas mendocina]
MAAKIQPRSRGLTRRRQRCCLSRMRVCAMFMRPTLVFLMKAGKHCVKIGRNNLWTLLGDV